MPFLEKKTLRAASLGLELALSMLVGFFIGFGLDRFFQTSPWLTLACFFFGLAAGVRTLYRFCQRTLERLEENEKE